MAEPVRETVEQKPRGPSNMSSSWFYTKTSAGLSWSFSCRRSPGAGDSPGQLHENRRGHHLLVWLRNHCECNSRLFQEGRHHFCVSRCFCSETMKSEMCWSSSFIEVRVLVLSSISLSHRCVLCLSFACFCATVLETVVQWLILSVVLCSGMRRPASPSRRVFRRPGASSNTSNTMTLMIWRGS